MRPSGFDPADPGTIVSLEHTPRSYTHFLKKGRLKGARFGLLLDALVTTPADQEVANVILSARGTLEALGATVIDVTIPDYTNVSNTSVITYEFARDLDALSRGHAFCAVQDAAGHLQSSEPVASVAERGSHQRACEPGEGAGLSQSARRPRDVFKTALAEGAG